MARKRFNMKFLVIGICAVLMVGALATAYKLRKRLFYPAPEKLVAQAKQLMDEGKYDEAGKLLYKAGEIRGADPVLYVMIGDVWDHLSGEGVNGMENFTKARSFWENALSADPRNMPAMERLLTRAQDWSETIPTPNSFQYLRETAQRMLVIDPENKKAQFLLHRGTIEGWRTGGDVSRSAVDESIEALEKLLKEEPSNANAFYELAAAKLQLADMAFRSNDDATARRYRDEIVAFAETSLQSQKENGLMQYRAAQIYAGVESLEKRLKGDDKKYEKLATDHLDRARELVKPGDERYVEIQLSYTAILAGKLREEKKDTAPAEQAMRELMKQVPDDMFIVLQLGEMIALDPKRTDEAMQLFQQPIPDVSKRGGLYALRSLEMESRLVSAQMRMRLARIASLQDATERQKEVQILDELYSRLQSKLGESAKVLAMKGSIELAKGKTMEAIQSLEASLRGGGQAPMERFQTMEMLARAYRATGQPGQAKKYLTEIVRAFPDHMPPRIGLAEMLLQENNVEEAKPHVKVIVEKLPADSPVSIKMQISVLDKNTEAAQRKKLFAQLPEQERAQILDKALFAIALMGDEELGIRLLENLRAATPDDTDVVTALAQHYVNKSKKPEAERVLTEALAKSPDNLQFKMMQKRLQAETPEEARSVTNEAVQNITDPFRKELRLFELALNDKKPDEAHVHLLNAEKLKPDDILVLDYLYQFHVVRKEFELAEQYLNRFAKIDPARAEIYRVGFALARNDVPLAMELAARLTRERGEFARSWLVLAEVQVSQGNVAEAITNYKAALDRDSRNLDAMRGLVGAYYKLSKPEEAKRYIELARRIYPSNDQFREMQLNHAVQHGDPEEAIEPRLSQLEADKEKPGNWYMLGQAYTAAARAKNNNGKESEGDAFQKKAMETFQAAYAKWPDEQRFAVAIAEISLKIEKPEEGEKAIRALMARPIYKDRNEPAAILAQFQEITGKTADAEKTYRELLSKTKDRGVQITLAELLFKQNRVDDALATLRELHADDPMIQRQRIEYLVRSDRAVDAQKELDAIAASGPPSAWMLDLQGLVYMESNRQSDALEALNKALKLEPRYAPALFRRGVLYAVRGDLTSSIQDLSAARDQVPTFTDARMKLAEAMRATGDAPGAMRELELAIRDQPANKALRLKLIDFYSKAVPPRWVDAEQVFRDARNIPALARDPQMLQVEAKMWAQRNDVQKALARVEEASRLDPSDMSIAQTYLDVLIKAKLHRDVLVNADRMLKVYPKHWWLYDARAIAKARSGDKDGALTDFETALQLANEKNDEVAATRVVGNMAEEVGFAAAMRRVEPRAQTEHRWRYVAMLLCRSQRDYPAALRWANMMLNDPKLSESQRDNVMRGAGDMYCSLSPPDYDKAMEIYKQLAVRAPNDAAVLNNLAAIMTMPGAAGRPEDALAYSEKAYHLTSNAGISDPAILDTHGSILVMTGRTEEGIGLLLQSIERKALPDTYFHLGDAYLRQGKPDEADRVLRQAKEMLAQAERDKQPVDPSLRQRIEDALLKASAMMSQKAASPG